MKLYLQIPMLLLVIYLGGVAVKYELGGQEIGFLSDFNYLPHFLFLLLAIPLFFVEWRYYQKTKKWSSFLITFSSVVICAIIFFKLLQKEMINKEATILTFKSFRVANHALAIELKEGNDFKLTEHSLFGQTIYYGKFARHGDTINIMHSNYDIKPPLEYGIIRNDTIQWNTLEKMSIEQNEKQDH